MCEAPVDDAVLDELVQDVGQAATSRMIGLFLEDLPNRVRRLRAAVLVRDVEKSRVAALSLSCSAAMLGARPLADTARRYVRGLPTQDPDPELLALADLARQACVELRTHRGAPTPAAGPG